MVAPQHLLEAAVLLLLVSSDLPCSSSPACPNSCTCQTPLLLNCSSSGLYLAPQLILESFIELDLSHNLLKSVTLHGPLHNLRSVRLGNNSITHLSLCLNGNYESQYLRNRRRHTGLRTRECVSWAPNLQLLSVERNQLEQFPQGLGAVKSLEVLQLSFNRIATLQMGDMSHLQHLKELHLQHNLITSLHPQIFMDLVQLKVIDLSFNMLTSLHPLIYLTVRNIGADIRLIENKWQCDCSMHNLKRQMAHDTSRGLQAWPMVCASPSKFSGRDILQLEEHDLNCSSTKHNPGIQDLIIHIGSETLLSSSTPGTKWRTRNGQSSVSQPQTALLIKDFTEKDTGLYVCVSDEQQVVSIFNLQISKMGGSKRGRRDLHPIGQHILTEGTLHRLGEGRNQQTTQSDLTLAVCLSVFITFLVAFILGVLARPCIDILWKRITRKRNGKTTRSVSSVEQRQYDNESFYLSGEPDVTGAGRERRVTFSTVDFIEDKAVQYYDTVARGNQQGISKDVVMACDVSEPKTKSGAASKSENRSQEKHQVVGRDVSGETDAHLRQNKFESIPDHAELYERCSLSSSSSSSDSSQTKKGKQVNKQEAGFSVDRNVEMCQMSMEGTTKIMRGSSETFADCSPPTEPDHNFSLEIGEQFEFSESGQSTPARSNSGFDSINSPKQIVTLKSDKEKTYETSSSSSYVSEDEPIGYTVNYDLSTEQHKSLEMKNINTDLMTSTVVSNQRNDRNEMQSPAKKINHSSSDSAVGGQELGKHSLKPETTQEILRETSLKATTLSHSKWRNLALSVTSYGDSWDAIALPSTGPLSSSSSSSNSEIEVPTHTAKKRGMQKQINKHLNIHASLSASTSSSSDENVEQTKHQVQKPQQSKMTRTKFKESQRKTVFSSERWPESDLEHLPRSENHVIIKTLDSDTPSDSDSEIETSHRGKRRLGKLTLKGKWQAVDLQRVHKVRRHLHVKVSSLRSDSSSVSDSEFEKPHQIDTKEQKLFNLSRPSAKKSRVRNNEQEKQWSPVALKFPTHGKTGLDIKKAMLSSSSSTQSESEDKITHQKNKHTLEKQSIAKTPTQSSELRNSNAAPEKPVINIQHIPHIKMHPNIKSSLLSESSSSSDNEESKHKARNFLGERILANSQCKVPQTVRNVPEAQWPAINLQRTTRIKRYLNIKALSLSSDSSSSNSEDDTTKLSQTVYHRQETQQPDKNLAQIHQTKRVPPPRPREARHKPTNEQSFFDLAHAEHVDGHLHVNAPSSSSDSFSDSFSTDSEDETTGPTLKQTPEKLKITGLRNQKYLVEYQSENWPAINLQDVPKVKRHLDITPLLPMTDSSSSGDSDDKATIHTRKQKRGTLHTPRLSKKISQSVSHEPENQWPAVDLQQTTHIKRYLDIKPTSLSLSLLSSNRDSECEKTHHKQKQGPGQLSITRLPSENYGPEAKWFAINPQHIPQVKRRLDIKPPISPLLDSSSSSDSEGDSTKHELKQKQRKLHLLETPIEIAQAVSQTPKTWEVPITVDKGQLGFPKVPSITTFKERHSPEEKWPTIDLQDIPHVKRCLHIKPILFSSSLPSSVSENQMVYHHQKHEQGKSFITRTISENYDPEGKWPAIDVNHVPHIKRCLNIKRFSTVSDSPSSSESEDEPKVHIEKQTHGDLYMSKYPIEVSQTQSLKPQVQWPLLDRQQNIPNDRHLLYPSSSSETEDEIVNTGKQAREMFGITSLQSQTGSYASDAKWPALDLQHIPHVKSHLDVKSSSAASILSLSNVSEDADLKENQHRSSSSSSSDGDDDTTDKTPNKKSANEEITRLHSESYDPEARWPLWDLQHMTRVKRHLDIKWSSPDEIIQLSAKEEQRVPIKISHESDIVYLTDIQTTALSLPHASDLSGGNKNQTVEIRRDKFYKSSSSQSSGSSDEQEKYREDFAHSKLKVRPHKDSRWSDVGFGSTLQVKRHLDVNNMSPFSDYHKYDQIDPTLKGITSYQPRKSLNDFGGSVTYKSKNRRSLDIRAPFPNSDMGLSGNSLSQKPESSSSSDSEENDEHNRAKIERGVHFTSKSSTKELFGSPKGSLELDQDIRLVKYANFSDDLANKAINYTTSVNPELQSQWATMNLGFSRFRKHLEVSSQTNEPLPSSPPPDSSNFSSGKDGTSNINRARRRRVVEMQGITQTDSSRGIKQTPKSSSYTWTSEDKSSDSFEVKGSLKKDYSFSTTEEKSNKYSLFTDFVVPRKKMSEKITITPPLHQHSDSSSSSSSSENKEEHQVPDLRHGIPRLKRRLNIRMLSPKLNTSASSSDDENDFTGHASNWTGTTDDDSIITYKRVIIKSPSLPSNSFSSGIYESSDRNRVSNMSVDDVMRERTEESKHNISVDMPPKIRWTGIGHHLSDLSSSTKRGSLISNMHYTETALPALSHVALPSCSDSSSSDSDNEKKQEDCKPKSTLTNEYSSISTDRALTSSSSILDRTEKSPDNTSETLRPVSVGKGERKGLMALKVMSASRQMWDKENADIFGTPQNDLSLNYHRSAMDIKSQSKPSLMPSHVFSTSAYATRETDSLQSIPCDRKHDIEYTRLPQDAPPPVQVTSPSEEAVLLTWRSPQSITNQQWEVNAIRQQNMNTNMTDPILLIPENLAQFDNKNTISEV